MRRTGRDTVGKMASDDIIQIVCQHVNCCFFSLFRLCTRSDCHYCWHQSLKIYIMKSASKYEYWHMKYIQFYFHWIFKQKIIIPTAYIMHMYYVMYTYKVHFIVLFSLNIFIIRQHQFDVRLSALSSFFALPTVINRLQWNWPQPTWFWSTPQNSIIIIQLILPILNFKYGRMPERHCKRISGRAILDTFEW